MFKFERGRRKGQTIGRICEPLQTHDADFYSYRHGFKSKKYYKKMKTILQTKWKNGIDKRKYKYDVEEDAV